MRPITARSEGCGLSSSAFLFWSTEVGRVVKVDLEPLRLAEDGAEARALGGVEARPGRVEFGFQPERLGRNPDAREVHPFPQQRIADRHAAALRTRSSTSTRRRTSRRRCRDSCRRGRSRACRRGRRRPRGGRSKAAGSMPRAANVALEIGDLLVGERVEHADQPALVGDVPALAAAWAKIGSRSRRRRPRRRGSGRRPRAAAGPPRCRATKRWLIIASKTAALSARMRSERVYGELISARPGPAARLRRRRARGRDRPGSTRRRRP